MQTDIADLKKTWLQNENMLFWSTSFDTFSCMNLHVTSAQNCHCPFAQDNQNLHLTT